MNTQERTRKIKVKDIIDDLQLQSIKAFILQYSKHDSSFEIAFKSHFISRIRTGIDENTKYKRILDEIIKPRNANNQKIGLTLKKTIGIVFKDLVLQMNDCLSTDNFTEAYSLIKESLEKVEYLQHRYYVKDVSIEKCRIQFLDGLEVIVDQELAPRFRSKIEKELLVLIDKSYFYPQQKNIVELLNEKNAFIEEDKTKISEGLYKKLKSAPDERNLIKTIIQLSHPFDHLAQKSLTVFGSDKIFKALKELIREGKFKYVDFYIENKNLNFSFDKTILNLLKLIERRENEIITQELQKLDLDIIPLVQLRSITDELSDFYLKKEFKKIKKWVNKLPFSIATNLYYRAQSYKDLLKLIEEKNDIEWLKVYDKGLMANDLEDEVFMVYKKITEVYISDHIGMKARNYLNKIHLHLVKLNKHQFADNLLDYISQQYKHRISLN